MSEDLIERLSRIHQVEALDRFRNIDLVYEGNLAVLGAGSYDVVLAYGGLLFKSPANAREELGPGDRPGDRDRLGAVRGALQQTRRRHPRAADTTRLKPFRIAAVYYDYSSDRGVVVMDRATFRKYFGVLQPSGVAAYLKPGADPEKVRGEMIEMLDEGHRAFIFSNQTLRREILVVFDSTFAITYALELIAIAVAMLGVAGTLLTLVLERRRELSLLRLTGADRRQVRRR